MCLPNKRSSIYLSVVAAALLIGRLNAGRAAAYAAAQCAGGALGFGALVALGVLGGTQGCTVPAISPVAAAFVEV